MIVKTHRQDSIVLLLTCQGSIVPAVAPKIFLGALMGVVAKLIDDGKFGGTMKEATAFAFSPFTALGVAISLFLGFHNNASYSRWWEARILWGKQIIEMRNLTRFLLAVAGGRGGEDGGRSNSIVVNGNAGLHEDSLAQRDAPDSDGGKCGKCTTAANVCDDWRRKIVVLAVAQTHALRSQLRPVCASDETTALQDRDRFLAPEELAVIANSRNPANAILMLAAELLGAARAQSEVDAYTAVAVARYIDSLCNIQAACERIHNTSLPFAYSLLVHRTAFLYVLLSPFAMASTLGWWTPVFTAILAYTFFGLDELARQIQEPFRDEPSCLALSAMSRTIEVDACEALGWEVPPFLKPRGVVLM